MAKEYKFNRLTLSDGILSLTAKVRVQPLSHNKDWELPVKDIRIIALDRNGDLDDVYDYIAFVDKSRNVFYLNNTFQFHGEEVLHELQKLLDFKFNSGEFVPRGTIVYPNQLAGKQLIRKIPFLKIFTEIFKRNATSVFEDEVEAYFQEANTDKQKSPF